MWFSPLNNLKRKQLEWLKRMCVLCTRFVRNICITKHETFKNKLTDRLVKSRPKSDGCQRNRPTYTLDAMHKTIYRRLDKHHMADCLWTLSHLRFVIALALRILVASRTTMCATVCIVWRYSCARTLSMHAQAHAMQMQWDYFSKGKRREKNILLSLSLSHFLSVWNRSFFIFRFEFEHRTIILFENNLHFFT